ncbi:MAG: calcium-binding protein [Hyphomicrobiaceae bacterium]|nr:calcium-binding protein [Hyphomicrobiaceae bacterium]
MATFTGGAGNDTANATTGILAGFTVTGGSGNNLADLLDNIGDTINGGAGNDTIVAGGGADVISGGNNADSIVGGNGNDFVRGFNGIDAMDGGAGFDEVAFESTVAGGLGTVAVSVNLATGAVLDEFGNAETIVNFESIRGTRFGDTLTGGAVANGTATFGRLDGFESFRGLGGADVITGGGGYDEVRHDRDAEFGGAAAVVVNLSTGTQLGVGANRARDGFGTIDVLSGIDGARGTGGSDAFFGNQGENSFTGLAGNDTMVGGLGFDSVRYDVGGPITGVTVNLQAGTASDGFGGTDTLSDIQGAGGTGFADTFIGNEFVGFFGDGFSGLGGADTMTGGIGFDEARYDNDVDSGGNGAAIVNLSTVARLGVAAGTARDGFGAIDTLIGIENVRGTNGADSFFGGTSNNRFRGLGGNDTLEGGNGDGNDTADYSSDADNGGGAGVVVNLSATTQLGVASNRARDGFGNIDTLIGIESARGTALADTLIGGTVDRSSFTGLAGNDTIIGGAGALDEARYDSDEFEGGAGGVTINLATGQATDGFGNTDTLSGIEVVRGTRFGDGFTGSSADETFRGLGGNDVMNGAAGSDWVSYSLDIFELEQGQSLASVLVNLDSVAHGGLGGGQAIDGFSATDTLIAIENAEGGALNDRLFGNAGGNIFRGLAGFDTIDGGAGIDTIDYSNDRRVGEIWFVNGSGAVTVNLGPVVGSAGQGTDGFGTADLLTSIENVIGTDLGDTFIGNSDANVLDGRAGADTMAGGLGNDTYVFDNAGDIANEASGQGTDLVRTSVSRALGANLENMILEGTASLNGSGNDLANNLIGNAGANVLDGRVGADRMFGQAGNDTYLVDNVGDVVGEVAGNGSDTVKSTISYTLGAEVEKLLLLGSASINGTGNALDNVLVGNNGANRLDGAAGVDNLTGGLGSDTLTGGLGNDRFIYASAAESGPGSAARDRILDFTAGDRLFLNTIDANTLLANDQAFVLDTDGSFSAGEIRQTVFGANLLLEMNTNGTAAAEMSILLIGRTALLGAGDIAL